MPSALTRNSGSTGAIFAQLRADRRRETRRLADPAAEHDQAGVDHGDHRADRLGDQPASPATTAAARSSPGAAAAKTWRADCVRMPALRAALTMADAEPAASMVPRLRTSSSAMP